MPKKTKLTEEILEPAIMATSRKKMKLSEEILEPEIVRKVLEKLERPCVLNGYLGNDGDSWTCLEWSLNRWEKVFGDFEFPVRFGKKMPARQKCREPQWESCCPKGSLTFQKLCSWDKSKIDVTLSEESSRNDVFSEESSVSSEDYWAYSDYFHMLSISMMKDLENDIKWINLGFEGRGSQDSTLWIGTKGSHTPCHKDTYGYNLVTQVVGSKKWIMFPKTEDKNLYPTRVPYEESSVYSEVPFHCPTSQKFVKLKKTQPYVVVLHPGDVLYVPNQWWHYVESLEFSISINTWIEMSSDHDERVKELFVKYQIGSLCQGVPTSEIVSKILNPNELDITTFSSESFLNMFVEKLKILNTMKKENKVPKESKNSLQDETVNYTIENLTYNSSTLQNESFNGITLVKSTNIEEVFCIKSLEEHEDVHRTESENMKATAIESLDGNEDVSTQSSLVDLTTMKNLVNIFTDARVLDVLEVVYKEKYN